MASIATLQSVNDVHEMRENSQKKFILRNLNALVFLTNPQAFIFEMSSLSINNLLALILITNGATMTRTHDVWITSRVLRPLDQLQVEFMTILSYIMSERWKIFSLAMKLLTV